MPTVVDALIVTLGLDPKDFTKGQREAAKAALQTQKDIEKAGAAQERAAAKAAKEIERSAKQAAKAEKDAAREIERERKKAAQEAEKQAKEMAAAQGKVSDSLDRTVRNALRLFAVFTAGRAVKDFVADITKADSAMGRLAQRIGSTPDAISGLSNAVARQGGSADAAAGSFQRLSDTILEMKTTGNSGALPYFAKLQGLSGKQIRLNTDLTTTFGDLADAATGTADRAGAPMANYLLRQAGVDQDTAALLIQGRAKLLEELAKSKKLGLVSKEDTDAARKLQTMLETLRQVSEGLGRSIMTTLTPVIVDLLKPLQQWIEANREWIRTEITARVREFGDYLKSIDWRSIGQGILNFVTGCNEAAKAVGGWGNVVKILFGLWLGKQFAAVLANIGLLRLALTGGKLSGGLMSALGALGTAGLAGILATSAATDAAVPNAQKPGVIVRSDDENTGGADAGGMFGVIGRGARSLYRRGRRLFGGGGGGESEGTGSGEGMRPRVRRGLDKLSRNANVQAIMGELRGAGYGDNAIAAVVGSMETESTFNPRAHNDVNGGHTGLWQWDRDRWPKIKRWIESQGGNPYDAAWQTKAWVAEHNAKPGDAIYDHPKTARGGAILRNTPTIDDAIHGVQLSERFGRGEEGGRARHAREWLPHVQKQAAPQAPAPLAPPPSPSTSAPKVMPQAAVAPNAWTGLPSAAAAVAQVHAAQSARIASISNDNRSSSTRSDTTHMHGAINVYSDARNSNDLVADLKQSLRGRTDAMSFNRGQA